MQREIEEIESRLKELKEAFLGSAGDGAEISWLGLVGAPTRSLLEQAHCADLIITGPASLKDSVRTVDTGALILSAGRPVLVTSQKADPLVAGRIVVAWKNTREARRAVADALPVLALADDVLVVGVNEGETGGLREELAGVVRYLMKHGIKARSELMSPAGDEFGFDISTAAFELGADLIVAGGYGHSRLREWAFGGVTRALLGASSVHRFFSN
jgi:nucleotide-binding universal stress UspA family protein